MAIQNIPFHPLAEIFPLIHGKEFVDLKADIKANGAHEPIVMFDGKILDGRNRFRACQEVGVTPNFVDYQGDDPVGYVISLNLHRRHLSESQRGMVAAKLADMPRHRPENKSANLRTSQVEAAEMLNVSERTVNTAKKVQATGTPELQEAVEQGRISVSAAADVASLPPEEQPEVVAKGEKEILQRAKEIRAAKTEARKKERMDNLANISKGNEELSVAKQYPVIYCDPPWRYEHAESSSREIENHYPTMSLEEICQLPVSDLAYKDAVLFMWATSPKLAESLEVVKAWGFTYRTCAVWDKQKIGMGYYFRQQHELLLVATRGSIPAPAPSDRPASVFSYPRGKHSSKPLEIYDVINSMYPQIGKIELFCRTPQPGWDVWGNQSGANPSFWGLHQPTNP